MIKTARDFRTYKKQIKEALQDQFMRSALDKFNMQYRENRPKIYDGVHFEGIRDEIANGKDQAIPVLMSLFDAFKKHAEAAGAIVHLARDAAEANEMILQIAAEQGVKKIVKSKSMTAEEIFLNSHLEAKGYEVTETDLGEWIVQLRHERPSHMVLPAIHLSRYQVGDLFAKVTREAQDPENIDRLVKVARKELRPAFLSADMGITGANFAIADSGTLGLVTNEGNMRLVTTIPRVHVALLGLEKLVPDLNSALRILKVLPRNATGQIITSYVTWIKGANESLSAPSNRKVMHIIFLDNGRLALAENPLFSTALRCIRCGACANVCPVYSKIGGHRYGHVYIGAIGLILTLFYHGTDNDRVIVQNCLNCQTCKTVCPSGIDLPHLIKKTHQAVMNAEHKKPIKNYLLSTVMKNRKMFHFLLRQASLFQQSIPPDTLMRHLPDFFSKAHGFRSIPPITRTPFRSQWRRIRHEVRDSSHAASFFVGCAIDFIYPDQGKALMKILKHENVALDFPETQTCCGLPLMMAGEEDAAREVAVQNLNAFSDKLSNPIITLCASCASHLKHNYLKLFETDLNPPKNLNRFIEKVMDFSSYMKNILKISPERFILSNKRVAYHAPCHLCRGLNVRNEPRQLISDAGFQYVPSKDEEVCCGFGGSYSIDFPEISAEILKQKLDHVETSKADILVTDCPGCVLQLKGGMEKRNGRVEVKHIAQLCADSIVQEKNS
jgi:iron-sulfur cluster protein